MLKAILIGIGSVVVVGAVGYVAHKKGYTKGIEVKATELAKTTMAKARGLVSKETGISA